jgi:ATP-dependent DNA helicase DinG
VLNAYVAFDCETSGLDPQAGEILQIAAVRFHEGRADAEWCELIRPTAPVPPAVLRLTGLDPDRLAQARPLEAVLPAFAEFVRGLPRVAHNAPFDEAFLAAALRQLGMDAIEAPVYDTHELVRLVAPLLPSRKLADLAERWAIPLDHAHQALADARAAGVLFGRLCSDLAALPPDLLGTLEHLLRPAGGALHRLVLDACGGLAAGPRVVLAPAAPRAAEGDAPPEPGAAGTADAPRARAEGPADGRPAFAADRVEALLDPGSALAAGIGAFEARPGQRRMLRAVARAFEQGRHLLVEAGTGTGKSLAYLLPALAWARAGGGRVVIATHTVNLQEQLLEREIPLARRHLPVRTALLKGRGHYLCLKLWEEQLAREPDAASAGLAARVAAWLSVTRTGDREELGFMGEDEERWAALSCEAVACTGKHCPWYDRCFLFRARRQAEEADVVVANHALLLADLNTGGQVLPEHRHVVVDEAHHLEDEASKSLGVRFGERRLASYLRGAGQRLGALRRLWEPESRIAGDVGQRAARAAAAARAAEAAVDAAEKEASAFFEGLRPWVGQRSGAGAHGRWTARFEPRREEDDAWRDLVATAERLAGRLGDLAEALGGAAEALDPLVDERRRAELEALASQAGELAASCRLAVGGAEGWVTWAEVAQRRGRPADAVLFGAPVDPGPILAERLFGERDSVVLTSATLAVAGGFGFVAERLGLGADPDRYDALAVASPFDYRRQALLCVPRDLPAARGVEPPDYASAVGPFLVRLFRATGGRALCLFTSNRMLRAVHAWCKGPLERDGIVVLAQGADGSRSRLAGALREPGATVVFGSASFWEGVDIPGEALSCVVLAQLPFWAPDIPLVQARVEAIEAAGRSSFEGLSLPQAVLRFKQGFGRLIRGAGDRGVAVCLDGRLVGARYGRVFLDSLPGPEVFVGSRDEVLARVCGWLGAPAAAAGGGEGAG